MPLSRLSWMSIIFTLSILCPNMAAAEQKIDDKSPKVQWAPYMKALQLHMKKYWTPPESCKPSHTVAAWTIHRDGTVADVRITKPGAKKADDSAVIKAIKEASPFDPLPQGAQDPCQIEWSFDSGKSQPLGLTVAQALKKFGPDARQGILKRFQSVGAVYPPKGTTWISLKNEKLLLIFARGEDGKWKQVVGYPVVSSSGELGPKLKEGDLQVPEGFYKTTALDARTHLCLWVDYPNSADQVRARLDHRTKLGGNIQIHEGVHSTGCVVIDHDAMAELFVLAHDTGCQNIDLIMAPCNLVVKNPDVDFAKQPKWLPKLYKDLKKALAGFPIAATTRPADR